MSGDQVAHRGLVGTSDRAAKRTPDEVTTSGPLTTRRRQRDTSSRDGDGRPSAPSDWGWAGHTLDTLHRDALGSAPTR